MDYLHDGHHILYITSEWYPSLSENTIENEQKPHTEYEDQKLTLIK